jgi:hypothetical protein
LFFKYGRRIGKSEEALLPDFLQTTLEAGQDDSNENIAVASFPNEPGGRQSSVRPRLRQFIPLSQSRRNKASATFSDADHAANIRNQDRMVQLAGSPDRVVP